MYTVYLCDDGNGNSYKRYESEDLFDCEVYVDWHIYDLPHDCHYEIIYTP